MKKGLDCRFLLLLVFFGLHESWSDYDFTLTTAVSRDATTPKPTAIYKRINVDPNVPKTSYAPLDLFRLRARESRRSDSDIWNWNFWCQLQAKTGNGTQVLNRYYYVALTDQCMAFMYSGIGGNKNNFESPIDCERYCKGTAYSTYVTQDWPTICGLQPDVGLCLGMVNRYYYDVNEDRCKNFIYGGCGGNNNRFETLVDCMSHCHPNHHIIKDHY